MNNDVEQSKVYIKQGEVTYLVVIALPKDALAAIKLSEVKVKSPTKKQENSSMRVTQISQYNALVLKEQREFRYSRRKSGTPESLSGSPSSSPSKKKVKFSL